MKKIILVTLMALSINAFAGIVTPMHIVEKSAHNLTSLVNKGKIDPSYLTDVNSLSLTSDGVNTKVTMLALSADQNNPNKLEITYDPNGKATSANSSFVSRNPNGPLFTNADAGKLLDLGAEAVVDHLSESNDLVNVAQNAQAVTLENENSGVLMVIHLKDGQIYSIHMDAEGNVISQGF